MTRWLRTLDRVLARPLVVLMRLYRWLISPLYGETCRFYPSCSAYALEALQSRGLVAGVRLAVWRLLRCNPWNAGGVDLVPAMRTTSTARGAGPATTGTRPGARVSCHHDGEPAFRHAA